MKRAAPLKRKTPLRRTGRLNPKSPKTGGHRFPKLVNEDFREYVRGLPCVLARHPDHICWGPVQACHFRTRGSGAPDDANLFPACARAHDTQHLMGIKSFQRGFLVDLAAIARRTWDAYRDGEGA